MALIIVHLRVLLPVVILLIGLTSTLVGLLDTFVWFETCDGDISGVDNNTDEKYDVDEVGNMNNGDDDNDIDGVAVMNNDVDNKGVDNNSDDGNDKVIELFL